MIGSDLVLKRNKSTNIVKNKRGKTIETEKPGRED